MNNFLPTLALFLSVSIFSVGCCGLEKNDCPTNAFVEAGECKCECDPGFTEVTNANGEMECVKASTTSGTNLAGNYKASEKCKSAGDFEYDCTISDSTSKIVIINNLFEDKKNTIWNIDGPNILTLGPGQKINNFDATGSGTFDVNAGTCNLNYKIQSGVPEDCSVTLTKQ